MAKRKKAAAPRAARTRSDRKVSARAAKPAGKQRAAKAARYVYYFGDGKADGDRTMKDTLGGKGSGLAEMTNAGLPVPPGFTISTQACNLYYDNRGKLTPAIESEIVTHVKKLEKSAKATLGSSTSVPASPASASCRCSRPSTSSTRPGRWSTRCCASRRTDGWSSCGATCRR